MRIIFLNEESSRHKVCSALSLSLSTTYPQTPVNRMHSHQLHARNDDREIFNLCKSIHHLVKETEESIAMRNPPLGFDLKAAAETASHNVNDNVNAHDLHTVFLTGGLQQLLNKNLNLKPIKDLNYDRHMQREECDPFDFLPDDILLTIFTFLGSRELTGIARVCKRWNTVSADQVLWKRRLWQDSKQWHIIGHSSNPHMFKECQSDFSYQEIYVRCSPEMCKLRKEENNNLHQLSSLLRSFLPKRTVRVAMFGPGLEMSTSGIVRKVLQDETGLFTTTAMFPGQFDGVGSGFTIQMRGGDSFNLMALYTSTQREREQARLDPRHHLNANHMLQLSDQQHNINSAEPVYELKQSIRDLTRSLDAVVLVIDASADSSIVAQGYPEFKAMIRELWTMPGVPVLVLSCCRNDSMPRVPAIDVVQLLHLTDLNRPWQVHDCCVDTLLGIKDAFTWLVQQAQRT